MSCSLAFEGEFVKGERTGRGLVFGTDGSKLFDGNFIKGSREGEGTEYRENGDILFLHRI